jgi:hypothetical protein
MLRPTKPSHIEFGETTVKPKDLDVLKRLEYFGGNEDDMIRFAGDKTIPKPKDDEIIVFRSFFWVGLRLYMFKITAEVLKKYRIFMHQLTPNVIAAKVSVLVPKVSARCTSYIIRRRQGLQTICTITLDVIILRQIGNNN